MSRKLGVRGCDWDIAFDKRLCLFFKYKSNRAGQAGGGSFKGKNYKPKKEFAYRMSARRFYVVGCEVRCSIVWLVVRRRDLRYNVVSCEMSRHVMGCDVASCCMISFWCDTIFLSCDIMRRRVLSCAQVPRKVTLQSHQIVWGSNNSAPATKSDIPKSPMLPLPWNLTCQHQINIAAAAKLTLQHHQMLRLPLKVRLQHHQLYSAPAPKSHITICDTNLMEIQWRTIWFEHDPRMKWSSRTHLFAVFFSHFGVHFVWKTFEISPSGYLAQFYHNVASATKSGAPTSSNGAPATKPASQNVAPATKSDGPTSPNVAPAFKSETPTVAPAMKNGIPSNISRY